MYKKIITITVLGLFTGMLALTACGHRRPHHRSPEKMAAWAADHIADELDFTDVQEQKLNKIRDEVVVKLKEQRSKHETERINALKLVKKDTITREELNKLANQRQAAHEEIKPFVIDKIIEFHSILTPDQKIKLADLMEKFHNKHR